MRILRLIGSMDPLTGGPCQGVRNSIAELTKGGVYNEVVSVDDPAASFLGQDSFIIHALGPGQGAWHYNGRLIPWLIANLPRFDVLIMHGLWLYPSYAAWKAINYLKKASSDLSRVPKFFIMPHGMLDPWFQDVKGRQLKALRNWLYWKLIEYKVVNNADGLLFTCETELLLARKPFSPYQPKREINVGYGVEEPPRFLDSMRESFLEKCPQIRHQAYFLFLSRIHYKKGVDLLLKAYADVLRSADEKRTSVPKLIMAGPGLETAYGRAILDLVNENPHLENTVFFTGMLTGSAKWGALYGCEAFVLPSHQENFGIAVVEALACGKPVLISDQVNIWREIEAGKGGLIYENRPDEIQRTLQQWLDFSGIETDSMGKLAYLVYRNNFSIEPAAKRLLKAIES